MYRLCLLLLLLDSSFRTCQGQDLHQEGTFLSKTHHGGLISKNYLSKIGAEDCPDPEAIAPCICYSVTSTGVDCTNAETSSQIATAFQQQFPLPQYGRFVISGDSSITSLDFSTNGVAFSEFIIESTTPSLESISASVFEDSAEVVKQITIINSSLTTQGFPFERLQSYTVLDNLNIQNSKIAEVPNIVSTSLDTLFLNVNDIQGINPGECLLTNTINIFYINKIFPNFIKKLVTILYFLNLRYMFFFFQSWL